MKFILAILVVILLIAFVAVVCTKESSLSSKQEEYLEECARQRLIQRQDEDVDLD